ncbi:methylated-DNA--[protein]-cysteine S-methyltransferase [Halobaculum sp. WSA2]|uniref:Methylated-DNA--[protein]-cysteine S-methyltransferase n=1 Tax=Halobaculum saliterrae TaxID=2073113 RepID=A0A6B0SX65_9EURY|nr:methylated-DNA--[protein]-cysteine S-methyltransferase [Halobaculum saliterrae]MXR40872.1 methylated-DNA--[protein]-cysteine S-methyltransferase [Halobaculum saliterrae]
MDPTAKRAAYDDPVTLAVPGGRLTLDASSVDAAADEIRRQAREYREGSRTAFDLSVRYPDGFTGRVMGAMATIPYGETRTYGDIAEDLDSAPQSVGAACGRNPVPLIVPCHRVVAAEGLGGFSAEGGPELKRRLLEHERSDSVQVTLDEAGGDRDGTEGSGPDEDCGENR